MSGTDREEPVERESNDNMNQDEDGAHVVLSLKWINPDQPQNVKRLESSLNKMLQTWLNKQELKVDCSVERTLTDGRVVIKTKPAPAITELQRVSEKTLTGKDGNSVTITAVSLTLPTEVDTQVPEDTSLNLPSTRPQPQMVHEQVQPRKQSNAGPAAAEESGTSSMSGPQPVDDQVQPHKQSNADPAAAEESGTSSMSEPQPVDEQVQPHKQSNAGPAAAEESGTSSVSEPQPVDEQVQPHKQSNAGPAAAEESGTSSMSEPQPVDEQVQTEKQSNAGPAAGEEQVQLEQQSSTASAAEEMLSCSVPVGLFWYVNHMYKEEMKRVEKENGVKIRAEVKVKLELDQKDGNPDKALDEFTNLIQNSTAESSGSVIPLKSVDPDQWSDALKTIQKKENKLLVTLTSEEMTVCGPRHSQDIIGKLVNADALQKNTNASLEGYERKIEDTSLKIDMITKDHLMQTGLTMEKSYWNLMISSYSEKVAKIKDKFNVELKESDAGQDKVTIKAFYKKDEGSASMESHAVRGLFHLYQKIATSPMNFSQSHATTGSWSWPWSWQ